MQRHMRARSATIALLAFSAVASAEPQPKPVDIKPFRAELLVFADAAGNTYVVKPHKEATDKTTKEDPRIFFGPAGKPLYEQGYQGRSANGAMWSYQSWAPRIPGIRPAYFTHNEDGTYHKQCDADDVVLTQLTGDKAKAVLDKSKFMTEFLIRRAHLLARDDSGVYYYVDHLAAAYGGKGYRVFVGKKGAVKQLPLSDVATDTAGEVYATKSGDLRLNREAKVGETKTDKAIWVRGEKRTELVSLDVDANSPLIFSDLGIYQFLGTLCDNI